MTFIHVYIPECSLELPDHARGVGGADDALRVEPAVEAARAVVVGLLLLAVQHAGLALLPRRLLLGLWGAIQ